MKHLARLLAIACVLVPAAAARAEVALPDILSDGMVLQRGESVPVWGTAADGEVVTVEFRGKTAQATAKDGKWRVDIPPGEPGGGMGNAVVGTLMITSMATALGVPLGLLAGVYLAEFGQGTWFAGAVRFSANILMGVPSIILGVIKIGRASCRERV